MTDPSSVPAGTRRVRVVTTAFVEEATNYCKTPPGCHSASPDADKCCGSAYWRDTGQGKTFEFEAPKGA